MVSPVESRALEKKKFLFERKGMWNQEFCVGNIKCGMCIQYPGGDEETAEFQRPKFWGMASTRAREVVSKATKMREIILRTEGRYRQRALLVEVMKMKGSPVLSLRQVD